MDSESQKNNKKILERSVLRRLRVDHSVLCSNVYGHQNIQQFADGSTVEVVEVDEAVEDVPRLSFDHAISRFYDVVDNGREFDRVYHIYGPRVALARVHVGVPGQSNRTRSELVDGPISRPGRSKGEGRRGRVVLAQWLTGSVGRDKPANSVLDVLVLYADDIDDCGLW